MNKRSHLIVATLCVALLAVSGCQKSNESESTSSGADSGLPASLFLAEAPTGVAPIATLKETAREGDTVTVRAIVGGKLKAYVTDRAVMTVIDVSVDNPCVSDDDHCHTPWDYCCNAPEERLENMASVQIVDADGRPLAVDLGGIEQVSPLNTLIIQGTVGPRPDETTLVIHATGIYVES